MVKLSAEKSCVPKIAPITGVIRSATSPVTTAPKAAPMTMPTARSTTFPRSRNALKSFRSLTFLSIAASYWKGGRSLQLLGLGDGSPASEVLAHVDGRAAVDQGLAFEERDAVGGAEGHDRVRVEGGECCARDRRVGRADDRDLPVRREVQVER